VLVVADLHHFTFICDPHRSEKSDPDPHQSKRKDLNPHQLDADPLDRYLIGATLIVRFFSSIQYMN
jgi:hypothetical protein